MKNPNYQPTIGIEVHVQLKTNSKIFCSCPNKFGDQPNSNICPICAGHPGVLPALNKRAVDAAIMMGLASNCTITRTSDFARKHYMYPDLPKNYQITQSDKPFCTDGFVEVTDEQGNDKKIRLVRIHLEEDAGKNIHGSGGTSWVDLNRAGTPLIEIVSHPDINSAHEARVYLNRLHTTVRYLGISDANMEEGSFRADVNISVRPTGQKELGTKIELKNINSFKFIVHAIEYEIERQIGMLESGQKLRQETRVWDNKQQKTFFMRSKEESQDYRYFTEPDLPVVMIDDAWIERISKTLPELPHAKFKRFTTQYKLSVQDSEVLTQEVALADFFEAAAHNSSNPKAICNWIMRDLLAYLKEHKLEISQTKLTPQSLAELVGAIDQGTINSKVAQEIFADMIKAGASVADIIKEKNLGQIGSSEELDAIVRKIVEANPDVVARYRAGDTRLFQFFVGQAMKETRGKGNPGMIQELLKKYVQ
ncbi:MAG: Asp-tRNA(Asn)/Glu-tRNA(Gln) amidotransferase subunit GatB [Candidatus Babeliales bacterium]|jgi:aspartyl-tRNA(Asn)/glutamyl-tRNA(Gln) amidotransferase subunit B